MRSFVSQSGHPLREGDGVQIDSGQTLDIRSSIGAEILLFDLD
ncbi:MAG: hypothetical protein AAGE92_17545 [Cyanobacteria bacterium P01_G01_bin.4]